MDAVLLLEAGFVRLVDDDDAEIGVRQEQGRARADDDLRIPARDGVPRAAALGRAQAAVPRHRLAAEARGEARQHRLGQRDLGQQDERLFPGLDRGGDGLHIDFGLARPGDAVEQQRLERRGGDGVAQRLCRRRLFVRQVGRGEGGIGFGIGGVGRDADRFERAGLHEAANHGLADIGQRCEFAHRALALADLFERDRPLRGHALGGFARGAIFDDRAARVGKGRARQHHPQHRTGGREIIVARPLDEAAQGRGHGRHRHDFVKVAQAVVADRLRRAEARILPHRAAHSPWSQRRDDDAAERRVASLRHAIVERAEGGGQKKDAGASHGWGRI